MEVDVQQRRLLIQLLLVLLPEADHFPQDLHIKALPLRLGVDVLLILCQRLDLLFDALDTLDESAQLITRYGTCFTHRLSSGSIRTRQGSGFQSLSARQANGRGKRKINPAVASS